MTPKQAHEFLKETYGPLVENINIFDREVVIEGTTFYITSVDRHHSRLELTSVKYWNDMTKSEDEIPKAEEIKE